jgi:hypothetical protein
MMSSQRASELISKIPAPGDRQIAKRILELAAALPRITADQHEEVIAEIHTLSGRLDYVFDDDFGAVVLEEAGDEVSGEQRRYLYRHALYRATWCAQAATAGGEGISRSRRIDRIKAKLA